MNRSSFHKTTFTGLNGEARYIEKISFKSNISSQKLFYKASSLNITTAC